VQTAGAEFYICEPNAVIIKPITIVIRGEWDGCTCSAHGRNYKCRHETWTDWMIILKQILGKAWGFGLDSSSSGEGPTR